ncbi:MAG: sugar phosphate isomerase/epimerase [Clostridia bacterium]|nr:sugar phosphate isomerase/epimerase [Clostridia bacterium]
MPISLPIGLRLHDAAPGTLSQRLAMAREQGFTCAHLALSKTVEGFQMSQAATRLTDAYAAEIKALFDANNQACALLGCYQQLTDPNPETLAATQNCYRAHLRFAPQMAAQLVGTETPAGSLTFEKPAPQSEEAFHLFVNGLRPVVRWAEEEGVRLAVEPVARHVISTPERAERLLDEIKSDQLFIILDVVNLLTSETAMDYEAITEDAIRRLDGRIALLHMKDFVLEEGAARLKAVACGTGTMRYEQLMRYSLRRHLPMTLENTRPDNAVFAREYLENAARQLQK